MQGLLHKCSSSKVVPRAMDPRRSRRQEGSCLTRSTSVSDVQLEDAELTFEVPPSIVERNRAFTENTRSDIT
jgi:hypothetical protein